MKLVNLVATATISSSLDLEGLEKKLHNSKIAAGGSRWLKYRLEPDGIYIAFYRSGKFLITGPNSREKATDVAKRVVKLLNDIGFKVSLISVDIHNLVVQDQIDLRISLEDLFRKLGPENTNYEPEQFPGLIFKDWGATFLIFSSGKLIMTGMKREEDIMGTLEKFKNIVSDSA